MTGFLTVEGFLTCHVTSRGIKYLDTDTVLSCDTNDFLRLVGVRTNTGVEPESIAFLAFTFLLSLVAVRLSGLRDGENG